MNRFFSKLDLRDIKIDPEGSRFPPDADESEKADQEEAPAVEAADQHVDHEEPVAEAVVTDHLPAAEPAWIDEPVQNGQAAPDDVPYSNAAVDSEMLPNGHAHDAEVSPAYADEAGYTGAVGEVLKVSARSRPSAVAGAIAGVVRESGRAEVQAIGAGATNQAVKAVAIARDYLRETGIEAVCLPAFIDVTIENEDRTAIRLVVEPRA